MQVKTGDIVREVQRGIIVQQVNAQGVMNSGVAKTIRGVYPNVWMKYSKITQPYVYAGRSTELLGRNIMVNVKEDLWVSNIVGQLFYGREPENQPGKRYTSYDALALGLSNLREFAVSQGITDVNFPLIGCGLGGAKWDIVSAILEEELKGLELTLWQLPK